jgi:rhodanese-related sulfurtransferase
MAVKHKKPHEAHEHLKKTPKAVYLDVRTEGEFAGGHPEGAINIPVVFIKGPGQMAPNPEFVEIVEQILTKDTPLVVGCLSGGRSARACEMLEEAGFEDLINVLGGFGGQRDQSGAVVVAGWRDAGLPVSSDVGDRHYAAIRKRAGR